MAVRATGLKDFHGDKYVTEPMLTSAIVAATANNMMAIKPFTFTARDMTPDNGTPTNLSIVIPGIVFNVFNNATGVAYGDIAYLDGNDSGKTRFTIEDYAGEGIVIDNEGNNSTAFTAYTFVLANGNPIAILPSESAVPVGEP